jgi:hypothetical protein
MTRPRIRLSASYQTGTCQFCFGVARYAVAGQDTAHGGLIALRVCPTHFTFIQTSPRSPYRVVASEGQNAWDVTQPLTIDAPPVSPLLRA